MRLPMSLNFGDRCGPEGGVKASLGAESSLHLPRLVDSPESLGRQRDISAHAKSKAGRTIRLCTARNREVEGGPFLYPPSMVNGHFATVAYTGC